MTCSIQYNSRVNRRTVWSGFLIVFPLFLLGQKGFAQQDFLTQATTTTTPRWVVGPASADLGGVADIAVPDGCRFTDQYGARTLLVSSREPVPANLVGLLVPDSHRWFAILQYTEIGYVKDTDKDKLNADAVLKKYQGDVERQNKQRVGAGSSAVISDVSWEVKPAYDPVLNKLEYALRATGAAGGSVNYVVDWLGRRGMLSVTIVQSAQGAFDPAVLRDALKGVAFKMGERYSDHQAQDRVARFGVADLILNSDGAEPPSLWVRLTRHRLFWPAAIGGGVVFVAGTYVLVVILVKRRKVRYYRMYDKNRGRQAVAAAQSAGAANGSAVNGNGHPVPQVANGQPALRVNGGFQRNAHRRRKKRFSYHAFYSDMVMNLTRCNYMGDSTGPLINNHRNGHSPNVEAAPVQDLSRNGNLPDTASLLVAETSKLIQSQQKLIEGQRKLIEEQSKLIQEKSLLLGTDVKALNKQTEAVAEQ